MKLILLLLALVLVTGCVSDCKDYAVEKCPDKCTVCPPCEVCSSISCQTEEFCKGIGFNKSWYEEIKARLDRQ